MLVDRILSLDLGTNTVGVAISDELGLTAHGLKNIPARPPEKVIEVLQLLIKEYNVSEMVVGLPVNLDGTIGRSAEAARDFARRLEAALPVAVHLYDERLTTVMAERALLEGNMSRKKRKGLRDRLAAVLILQGYLDRKRNVT